MEKRQKVKFFTIAICVLSIAFVICLSAFFIQYSSYSEPITHRTSNILFHLEEENYTAIYQYLMDNKAANYEQSEESAKLEETAKEKIDLFVQTAVDFSDGVSYND